MNYYVGLADSCNKELQFQGYSRKLLELELGEGNICYNKNDIIWNNISWDDDITIEDAFIYDENILLYECELTSFLVIKKSYVMSVSFPKGSLYIDFCSEELCPEILLNEFRMRNVML